MPHLIPSPNLRRNRLIKVLINFNPININHNNKTSCRRNNNSNNNNLNILNIIILINNKMPASTMIPCLVLTWLHKIPNSQNLKTISVICTLTRRLSFLIKKKANRTKIRVQCYFLAITRISITTLKKVFTTTMKTMLINKSSTLIPSQSKSKMVMKTTTIITTMLIRITISPKMCTFLTITIKAWITNINKKLFLNNPLLFLPNNVWFNKTLNKARILKYLKL